MRRALLGASLVVAICVASVLGQQPEDFAKKGGKGGRGGKGFRGGEGVPKLEAPPPHRWEYAVRNTVELQESGGGDLQRGLNRMGETGWELVAVDGRNYAYFKRPRNGPLPPAEEGAARDQLAPPMAPIPQGFGGGFAGFARGRASNIPAQKETTAIIQLRNAQANSTAQILSSIFPNGGRFVPDSRTARLILVAPEDKMAEIRKLIEELDQPVAPDRRNTK